MLPPRCTSYTCRMAFPWLLSVEQDAFLVKPGFIERLRKRNPSAMRQLATADLTELYRTRFSRLKKRQIPGLFWSDMPEHERIAVVRGGRNPPPAVVLDTVIEGGRRVRIRQPNPKFELVVVNRYDRAALLNLLTALDSASNVETWLAERTTRTGATQADVLFEDYRAWCAKRDEAPTGSKSFSQTLVVARVRKLKRGKGGSRYELELCQRSPR